MNKEDSIIFLTDKYGKRDRTTEIENLTYDNVKGIWNIDFVGDQRTFHYKNENVKIIKNCLKGKQSATEFDYLYRWHNLVTLKMMKDRIFL